MKQDDQVLLNEKPSLNVLLRTTLKQWCDTPLVKYDRVSDDPVVLVSRIRDLMESVLNRLMVFDKVSEDINRIDYYHAELGNITDLVAPLVSNYNLNNNEDVGVLVARLNELRTSYVDSLFSNGLYTSSMMDSISDTGDLIENLSEYTKVLWGSIMMDTVNPVGRRSKKERDHEIDTLKNYPLFGYQQHIAMSVIQDTALDNYEFILVDSTLSRVVFTPSTSISWLNGKPNVNFISELQNVLNPTTVLRLKSVVEIVESMSEFSANEDKIKKLYGDFLMQLEQILYVIQFKVQSLLLLLETTSNAIIQSFDVNWTYLCHTLTSMESIHHDEYAEIIRVVIMNIVENENELRRQ